MDVIDQTGRVFRLARRVAVIGVGAVVFGVVMLACGIGGMIRGDGGFTDPVAGLVLMGIAFGGMAVGGAWLVAAWWRQRVVILEEELRLVGVLRTRRMARREVERVRWVRQGRKVVVLAAEQRVGIDLQTFARRGELIAAIHGWAPAGTEEGYAAFVAQQAPARVGSAGLRWMAAGSVALAGSWWAVRGWEMAAFGVLFLGVFWCPMVAILSGMDFLRRRGWREAAALGVAVAGLVVYGCAVRARWGFAVDANKPFVVELGRGSGMRGLDVVVVRETGEVEMERGARRERAEHGELRLTPGQVAAVAAFVNREHLTGLARVYEDRGMADGSQWVLWIEQGDRRQAVYFNNAFPGSVRRFAAGVDEVLGEAGVEQVAWREVEGRAVALELWGRVP